MRREPTHHVLDKSLLQGSWRRGNAGCTATHGVQVGTASTFCVSPVLSLLRALSVKTPKASYYVTTPTYMASWMRRLLPQRALDYLLTRG